MKIAKTIKQRLDTISGKRHLTILNNYIKETYKEPEHEMRNVVGEYSPKDIIEQMRVVVAYVKDLCARQGRKLTRYYSYGRIQEIENAFSSLASHYEGVSNATGKTALRNLLVSSAESLEIIKPLLGPFFDLRLDEAVQNITSQIVVHQEDLQHIQDMAKEVGKQANAIQRHFDKSEAATKVFETLIKETQALQKQLEIQQLAAQGIYDKTKTVSKQVDKLNTRFEEKLELLDKTTEEVQDMKERIEGEYHSVIERSREFEVVVARIEQAELQAKNIIHQARHALNISQGAGFLESYRELYENSSRLREHLPWAIGSFIGFFACVAAITLNVVNIRALADIMEIFTYPSLLGQIILVPIALFCFFFCLLQGRKKNQMQRKYQSRYAALETYLKLSEHLPYDSPEQIRTASSIMKYLEEDFNPLAVRSMFNTVPISDNISFR